MATPADLQTLNATWRRLCVLAGFAPVDFPFDLFTGGTMASTVEALNIYVDATLGSDTNDGTQARPYASMAPIATRLNGCLFKHPVVVNLAAGNYAGVSFSGFRFDPANAAASVSAYFRLLGTVANATLATGSATGTTTSTTAGSFNPYVNRIITDSTQAWTVNDLVGKSIYFNTGSLAGIPLPILSNTATTVTVPDTLFFAPANGTSYSIVNMASVITGNVNLPASFGGTTNQTAALVFSDIRGQARVSQIQVDNININPPAATTFGILGSNLDAQLNCRGIQVNSWSPSGSSVAVCFMNAGQATLRQSFILGNSNMTGVRIGNSLTSGQAPGATIVNTHFKSCGTAANFATGSQGVTFGTNQIDGGTFGVDIAAGGYFVISPLKIDGTSSQGIRCRSISNSAPGQAYIVMSSGVVISNVTASSAIELEGPHFLSVSASLARIEGSNNLTAMNLSRGARLGYSSTSTLTGTTEISLDGVATTVAALRAASPKVLTNTYGTVIFE